MFKSAGLVVLFILVSWSCRAQAASDALSISGVVALARSAHPLVKEREAALRAAHALKEQAGRRPIPELDVEMGHKKAGDNGYEVGLALSFPVERAEKRTARLGVAESDVQIARVSLAQERGDVELQARIGCYEYLAASADAEAAREIAGRSHAMVALLKQRPAAGPGILLELRVIEAGLIALEKSALESEALRDSARIKINALLGRPLTNTLVLTDTLAAPTRAIDFAALAEAVERDPSILKKMAEVQRTASEAALSAQEAWPDYRVGPYYSREDAGDVEGVFGVAISIPLARRGSFRGAIVERYETAKAAWTAERMNRLSEVARMQRLYELAIRQANEISETQVETLRDAAALADRQYRIGAIPVSLFLEMQREFLAVQQLRHEVLLNALTKEAELNRILGEVGLEGDS